MDAREELLGADLVEHRIRHTQVFFIFYFFSDQSTINFYVM